MGTFAAATSRRWGRSPKVRRVWPPGTRTSGLTALTRPPPRPLRRAAGWRWSLSTSCKPAGWQCSPTPREPLSTSGRPRTHKGAKIVNEHGALNFNGLAVRDVEGAKAFYRAVFGWATLEMPMGVLWTLPGYGDHLEERTPGLRQQMGQMGAPNGFIDVVAALNPIAGDDSQTPAHWNVTFGVDDAVVTAAKAKELGGEVVAGPYDAPWTRLAVIKDPQGATFVAGQFVPENRDLTA